MDIFDKIKETFTPEDAGKAVGAGVGTAWFANAVGASAIAATTGLTATGVVVACAVPLAGAAAGYGIVKGIQAGYEMYQDSEKEDK
ncbi:MAG: hypothetical protein MJK15_02485 [Colwellia sp.]|nr:hypothetical protein [Colwellia sp.]